MRDIITTMIKVLLDTNVLIDADKGVGSFGYRIIDLVLNNQVLGVISRSVANENSLIINRLINDIALKDQVSRYLAKCQKIEVAIINVKLADSEDVKILAAAVVGKADFLITEDRHLLDLDEYQRVKIVRPKEWWQWWERQRDDSGETWNTWAKNILGKPPH